MDIDFELHKLSPSHGDVIVVRAKVSDHKDLIEAIQRYQWARKETFTWIVEAPETSVELLDAEAMLRAGWVRAEKTLATPHVFDFRETYRQHKACDAWVNPITGKCPDCGQA